VQVLRKISKEFRAYSKLIADNKLIADEFSIHFINIQII